MISIYCRIQKREENFGKETRQLIMDVGFSKAWRWDWTKHKALEELWGVLLSRSICSSQVTIPMDFFQ